MGRATRWLRGLLGGGKKSPAADSVESSEAQSVKEKKKWGFGKSFREKRAPPRQMPGAEELGGSYRTTPVTRSTMTRAYGAGAAAGRDDDEEQNKRAIAVAAATAAVAEAAVAAAQAAAAVVRLTSSGRGAGGFVGAVAAEYGKREERAVVKIQSAFRGYLARRALRALRGLVKLQALVRGNIVRKQAAETLRCMQALVRVQARARACRALRPEKSSAARGHCTRSGSPTAEKNNHSTRMNTTKSIRSSTSRRNSCKSLGADGSDSVNYVGQNWLDGWMEERYHDSRTTGKRAGILTSADDDKSAKILEVDSGKPQYNNRRLNNCSPCSTLTSDQNSHSFATMPESPSKDSTTVLQSVPSPASVDMQQSPTTLVFPFDVRDYGESPQFYSASSRPGSSRKGPFTPAKSECSRSFFSEFSDYPNYMAYTESSRAKFRSQSAPKQRPDYDNPSSIKRSVPHAYLQNPSRSSSLHAKFANKAYPGSGRLDRLGMPVKG